MGGRVVPRPRLQLFHLQVGSLSYLISAKTHFAETRTWRGFSRDLHIGRAAVSSVIVLENCEIVAENAGS